MNGPHQLELVPIEPREAARTPCVERTLATPQPYLTAREAESERASARAAKARALQRLRRPPCEEDLRLSEPASRWLAALPEAVRPVALAAEFPRIVNRLCALWRRPLEADAYFDDLLIDHRGDRQGFPLAVAIELSTLKEYYCTEVFPLRRTIWDDQYTSTRAREQKSAELGPQEVPAIRALVSGAAGPTRESAPRRALLPGPGRNEPNQPNGASPLGKTQANTHWRS